MSYVIAILIGLPLITVMFLFFPIIYRKNKGPSEMSKSFLLSFINTVIVGLFLFLITLYGSEGRPYPWAGLIFICVIIFIVSFFVFNKKKKKPARKSTVRSTSVGRDDDEQKTSPENDNETGEDNKIDGE